MMGNKPAKDLQEFAKSLASVANNSEQLDILIFGAGLGGLAMLEVFRHFDDVSIHAIVDITENAPAFQLAHQLGINTSTDRDAALNAFHGDIVIDVTGDPALHDQLISFTQPHHIELISAKSAKLLFELADQELHSEHTIETQNTRLSLLDCMLEITLQLEKRPPIHDITYRSFEDIHEHVSANKGIAVMFDKADGQLQFVRAIGSQAPECSDLQCDASACHAINDACGTLSRQERYKVFEAPVKLHCSKLNTSYNIILPLWQDSRLAGALLFDISLPLTNEQNTILEMASLHLNMTFKTLDHFQQLEEMAIFDSLTGVFNRRKFDMQLHQEVCRIKRTANGTLSCGFIDLDDFKHINDTYGHPVGDLVLKHIGHSIESCLRDYDLCARYGGDEFVILMPADISIHGTGLEALGLRILKNVAKFRLANEPDLRVSISIGIATQSGEIVDAESLLKQADKALYEAKNAGKGCLRIFANEQFHYMDDETND